MTLLFKKLVYSVCSKNKIGENEKGKPTRVYFCEKITIR